MLFDINQIKEQPIEENEEFLEEIPAKKNIFISSHDQYLSKKLKDIDFSKPDINFHFTSNGEFGLHDIIIHIANKIGKCDVIITSFNISEKAAKKLIRAWDNEIFKSLKFALNGVKSASSKKGLNLIKDKFEIAYVQIHAKVALLSTEKNKIVIITTGNLSNNHNYERGIITTDPKIYDFDSKWISELFNRNDKSD